MQGKVSFNFTSSFDRKLRLLAHNKELFLVVIRKKCYCKKLMVTNFPRFRERFDSHHRKVANITNETKTGIFVLQLLTNLYDAANRC
jgi:thioredoxin-related protein